MKHFLKLTDIKNWFSKLENKEGKSNDPEDEPTEIYYPKNISPQTLKKKPFVDQHVRQHKTMNSGKDRIL